MNTIDELWQLLVSRLAVGSAMPAEGPVPSAAHRAFANWTVQVEPRLRWSLKSFATQIDVESAVQEALLRMWVVAQGVAAGERKPLVGENASIRFALHMTRNLALNMKRKSSREDLTDSLDGIIDDLDSERSSESDPFLRQAIHECLELLTKNPLKAIRVRIGQGHRPETEQAELAGMAKNTFHQNIRRARLQLVECLADKGIELGVVA